MATSGRANSGSGNFTYFYFQWQLAGQNVGSNYSTINWQGGINISNSAFWGSNSIKIYDVYINGSGNLASGTWSSISGNGDHQLVSGSWNIGHNGDGTKSFGAQLDGWLYSNGNYTAGGGWDLPQIPRYANFTAFNILNITDAGFTIQIGADNYCSDIGYSIDNGATYTSLGAGSSANAYLTNLPSGTTYNIYAYITRADSGLTSYTGLAQATTLLQNNFLGLLM